MVIDAEPATTLISSTPPTNDAGAPVTTGAPCHEPTNLNVDGPSEVTVAVIGAPDDRPMRATSNVPVDRFFNVAVNELDGGVEPTVCQRVPAITYGVD